MAAFPLLTRREQPVERISGGGPRKQNRNVQENHEQQLARPMLGKNTDTERTEGTGDGGEKCRRSKIERWGQSEKPGGKVEAVHHGPRLISTRDGHAYS